MNIKFRKTDITTTPVTMTAIMFLKNNAAARQKTAAIVASIPPQIIWGAIIDTIMVPGIYIKVCSKRRGIFLILLEI